MSTPTTIQRAARRQQLVLILSLAGLLIPPTKTLKSESLEQPTPLNHTAPELVGGPWLNTPGDQPVSLASRRGKVTIVHFWTYGCYNCQNNLAAYARWYQQFAGRDVVIVGIHTPETSSERVGANVVRHVKDFKIEYPVLFDQSETNWRRWQQRYWPTVYLIDRKGKVRFRWIGELNYGGKQGEARMAKLVEDLLREPVSP
jgi:alkyl hydroperoxide reductase subunit AhpC